MKTKFSQYKQENMEEKIQELMQTSMKKVIGRFDCKELDEKKFLSELLNNFEIKLKQNPNASTMNVRIKLQETIQSNSRSAIGDFHSKEFNETCFLNDLFKKFELTPKQI